MKNGAFNGMFTKIRHYRQFVLSVFICYVPSEFGKSRVDFQTDFCVACPVFPCKFSQREAVEEAVDYQELLPFGQLPDNTADIFGSLLSFRKLLNIRAVRNLFCLFIVKRTGSVQLLLPFDVPLFVSLACVRPVNPDVACHLCSVLKAERFFLLIAKTSV